MKTIKDTPKQVADNVRRNLYGKQTLTSIGQIFDVSPERVRQVLDGTSYLSAKWARRFADAFGFNALYLISGEGDLVEKMVSAGLAKEYCILRNQMEKMKKLWEEIKDSSTVSPKEKNAARREFFYAKMQYEKISERFYSEIGLNEFIQNNDNLEADDLLG